MPRHHDEEGTISSPQGRSVGTTARMRHDQAKHFEDNDANRHSADLAALDTTITRLFAQEAWHAPVV